MAALTLFSKLSTGYRILDIPCFAFIGYIAVILITYCLTSIRFHRAKKQNHEALGEPPILPYWTPYIGHRFQMHRLHKLCDFAVSSTSSHNKGCVRLVIGSTEMYLVFGVENISTLFQHSKFLARDNLTSQAVRSSATHRIDIDTGRATLISPSSRKRAEMEAKAVRIGRKLHDLQHHHLSQQPDIDSIAHKFHEELEKQLNLAQEKLLWATYKFKSSPTAFSKPTPLFELLKERMFVASTIALMGQTIFELVPDLTKIYWAYDEAFLLGEPELVYPEGEGARDKLLDAVRRYVGQVQDDDDLDNIFLWDRKFGCRLFRASLKEMRDQGIAKEDQATAILSLVWATASNSIPLTAWMLATVLEDPLLFSDLRNQLQLAVIDPPDNGYLSPSRPVQLDFAKLSSLSLLNSLYHECLRMRSSVTVSRRLTADVKIDGYTLRKGNFIMATSYLAQTDHTIWDDKDGHSADSLWARRFVGTSRETGKMQLGAFLPYGGGNAICPGRFFSKIQILSAVAVTLLAFDIKLDHYRHWSGKWEVADTPEPDQRYAGGGVMPPVGDWAVQIRRREKEKHA